MLDEELYCISGILKEGLNSLSKTDNKKYVDLSERIQRYIMSNQSIEFTIERGEIVLAQRIREYAKANKMEAGGLALWVLKNEEMFDKVFAK